MQKCFKVLIRSSNDERIEIIVKGDNIATVAKDFNGTQLTFIPTKHADFHSFSIFTHNIKKIEYEAVSLTPFDNTPVYEVLSFK